MKIQSYETTPDDVADDAAWDTYIGMGNLGFTKTFIDYGQTITSNPVAGPWIPVVIAGQADNRITISNVPTSITLDDDTRYVIQVATASGYTGTVSVSGADITVENPGGALGRVWEIFTAAGDASAVPAIDEPVFTSTTGNSVTVTTNTFSGDSIQISGDVVITGDGISYDPALNAFVIAGATGGFTLPYINSVTQNATTGVITANGGNSYANQTVDGVWDNFRYATLLTTGFLLTEGTTTGTVDQYTDTNGIIGVAGTSYFFQNSNDAWYNTLTNAQAAGATGRLIAFP